MSAEVTTPDISSALEGARSALAAKMSPSSASPATEAIPTPTPVAAPSPEPASAPAPSISTTPATMIRPATGTEPASPAAPPVPATSASPALNLETLSPAARRFLEMNGGNLDQALAKALGYNNRLGAAHKAHPELFEPGGPADPKATPLPPDQSTLYDEPTSPVAVSPTPAPTATGIAGQQPQIPTPEVAPPEVQIDWNQVAAATDDFVLKDPTCTSLVKAWADNTKAIQAADTQIDALKHDRAYLEAKAKDSSLGLTDIDKGEIEDRILKLRYEITLAETEKRNLALQNDDLGSRFNKIKEAVQEHISRGYYETAQQQAQAAELQALEDRSYEELKAAWTPAVPRVATALGIPADLVSDFEVEARRTVQAQYVTDPAFMLNDVEGFLTNVGKSYLGRMDRYHRAQAGVYAQQALARASAPSPTLPAGTPVPTSKPDAQLTPEEAMANISRELSQRLRR